MFWILSERIKILAVAKVSQWVSCRKKKIWIENKCIEEKNYANSEKQVNSIFADLHRSKSAVRIAKLDIQKVSL